MISLRALFDLVTLPIKLLLALLKYPIFGGVNKRYKNDLAEFFESYSLSFFD